MANPISPQHKHPNEFLNEEDIKEHNDLADLWIKCDEQLKKNYFAHERQQDLGRHGQVLYDNVAFLLELKLEELTNAISLERERLNQLVKQRKQEAKDYFNSPR